MFKNITEALKELFLKISFACCCKSKCQVQIGKEEKRNDSNDNSDISNQVTTQL